MGEYGTSLTFSCPFGDVPCGCLAVVGLAQCHANIGLYFAFCLTLCVSACVIFELFQFFLQLGPYELMTWKSFERCGSRFISFVASTNVPRDWLGGGAR
jgi:hypothetical protein